MSSLMPNLVRREPAASVQHQAADRPSEHGEALQPAPANPA